MSRPDDNTLGITTIIAMVIGAAFIVSIVLIYKDCQSVDQRRMECVQVTHDPEKCHQLFPH